MLPPKYLANLTPQQKLLQSRLIKQSQNLYERTGKVTERPRVSSSKTPRSSHAAEFQERFGFPITNLKRVRATFPDTDVSAILGKGAAAYASSGSRPNVSSFQWRMARLASVLTGGKAYQIDKDLVGNQSKNKIFGKEE